MIHGILAIDKPQGWTSHDVVARVRRLTGQRQVGHAGTLDPLATGVLLLVLGRATRVASYLMESEKVYCAEVVLGATTITDDAEGTLLRRSELPYLSNDQLSDCLSRFVGWIDQVPPIYAAVRHKGERLYKLARQGIEVQPEPRHVQIYEIVIQVYDPPRLRLWVRCGSGTYIRSLARDIGEALGVGGYLHALRRVWSGAFSASGSVSLEGLTRETIQRTVKPMDLAILDLPAAVLSRQQVEKIASGQHVEMSGTARGPVRLYDQSGTLTALGEAVGTRVKPFRVFVGVESGAHSH